MQTAALNQPVPSTAPGDSPTVLVEDVQKQFIQGAVRIDALKGAGLTVQPGEFVAIMGASGSGKSTLLHLIAGLTPPSGGRVTVDGRNLADMSDRQLTLFRRRQIGLVFQAFNLIPALTAEQNVLLPVMADRQDRAAAGGLDELLNQLGLQDRRHHRPDALSGGEQQRVAIARALITNPSLVLADEPTGSIDSVAGQDICRILRDLCRQHSRTIVLVTHEPAVAIWAQRVVILKDGRNLTEFDTSTFANAHELAARYQDVVSAASPREQQA